MMSDYIQKEVEDLKKPVEEQDRLQLAKALRRKEALEGLINSSGWKILCEVWNAQLQNRINTVMSFAVGEHSQIDTVYKQEFLKGEYAGLLIAMKTPKSVIESDEATIQVINRRDVDMEDELDV